MALLLMASQVQAQRWQWLDSSQTGVSFRGLSVVNDTLVWVSGSKGTIGKTTNGGRSWKWYHPKGLEKRDFRDIHAFSDKEAIALAVDSPGLIIKTYDGGATWKTVYRSRQKGIFLDAFDFYGQRGYCVGDPINGKFWLLQSTNAGNSWQLLTDNNRPDALPGEACFAASGSNLLLVPDTSEGPAIMFVTGGSASRMHLLTPMGKKALDLPLQKGKATTGANSMAYSANGLLIAGGDFNEPARADSTVMMFTFNGTKPTMAKGVAYKSCIATNPEQTLVACGILGVWMAQYKGSDQVVAWENWRSIISTPLHVVQCATQTNVAFAAGPKGRIGKLSW